MKQKKKITSILLLTTLLISMISISAIAENTTIDLTADQHIIIVDDCYEIATSALREYYESVDLGISAQLDNNIFNNDRSYGYIMNKMAAKEYIAEEADLLKENYELSFNLLAVEQTDEYCKLAIQTEATFNYIGMEDMQSGFGHISEITIVLDNNEYRIADWYNPYDGYDKQVRVQKSIEIDAADMEEKQNKYLEDLEYYFENEYDTVDTLESVSQIERAPRASTALNKSNIVSYAKNNRVSYPSSGGSNVPYYDFSQLSGNWDCTNYVSHALLAGGATPYITTSGSSPRSTGWYYKSLNDRSSSWSGVTNLHSFLTTNTTKGPYGTSAGYSLYLVPSGSPITNAPFQLGDILQHHDGNIWHHSTIITNVYQAGYQTYGAIVCGRSANGQYNNNIKAEEIYPGNSKRVIKLSGNYS